MNGFYTELIGLSDFLLKIIHRLAAVIRYFRVERSIIGDHFCESRNDGHLENSLNLLLFLSLKFSLIASFFFFFFKWMKLFPYGIFQCV